MDKLTIRDVDVAGKTVLVRVDFNVPMKDNGTVITDDNRIVAALPTINYLLEHNPKAVVLFSHLGKIKTEEDKAKNNMAVVAPRLAELLNRDVEFVDDHFVGRQQLPLVRTAVSGGHAVVDGPVVEGKILILVGRVLYDEIDGGVGKAVLVGVPPPGVQPDAVVRRILQHRAEFNQVFQPDGSAQDQAGVGGGDRVVVVHVGGVEFGGARRIVLQTDGGPQRQTGVGGGYAAVAVNVAYGQITFGGSGQCHHGGQQGDKADRHQQFCVFHQMYLLFL